jgi:hypothetical protein
MRSLFVLLAALVCSSGPAFGWGCEGHQIVALIARAHLTPAAWAAVDQLLRENPIDPALNRFCKDRPADLMADSATWADDVKNVEKTGDWHFIDIPIAVNPARGQEPDVMQWCKPADGKPGCIVSAIALESGILRDMTRPAADRAKALRYVIHLIGDLSQPLHASDNRDRGGNCTAIQFFDQEKPDNLHSIWDYRIIAKHLADRQMTQARYAVTLDKAYYPDWPWGFNMNIDVPAQAWDSHAMAVVFTYGNLMPPIPVAPANAGLADNNACNAERDTVQALHINVGAEYDSKALPVIDEQLAKAGFRLADLLNQTFK